MRSGKKNLTILSEAERAALYESPDFDHEQRLEYLNFSADEQTLMRGRPHLAAQIHCALQIGYFKAKHLFFRVDWQEAEEDVAFILEQYFPNQIFHQESITKHQYYVQCQLISQHFNYRLWSKELTQLLLNKANDILRKDISPQFVVMELLAFLREKKIMRPGYSTLQTIVSNALSNEKNRLGPLVHEALSESDKSLLKELLQ